MNCIHVEKCRKGMNQNERLHNTRDVFKWSSLETHVFLTKIYLKLVKDTSRILEIFILIRTFATAVKMNTVHRYGYSLDTFFFSYATIYDLICTLYATSFILYHLVCEEQSYGRSFFCSASRCMSYLYHI